MLPLFSRPQARDPEQCCQDRRQHPRQTPFDSLTHAGRSLLERSGPELAFATRRLGSSSRRISLLKCHHSWEYHVQLSAKHLGTMLLSLRTSAVLCKQSQLFERFLAVALVHVQGFLSLNHLNRYDFLHTPPIMAMEGQTSLNDSLDW
jgi:hypothetical protein